MGKGRPKKRNFQYLTDLQKGEIIGLAKGYEQENKKPNNSAIARVVGCSEGSVRNVLGKVRKKEPLDHKPRPGRPRDTTPAEDRALKLRSLRDRRLTAVDLHPTVITSMADGER